MVALLDPARIGVKLSEELQLHPEQSTDAFVAAPPGGQVLQRHVNAIPGAVLFDMDGTLIDSEPLWLEAEHEVMADLGGTWSDADQAKCLGVRWSGWSTT